MDYEELSGRDLEQLLKDRMLPVTGIKVDLIRRLREDDNKERKKVNSHAPNNEGTEKKMFADHRPPPYRADTPRAAPVGHRRPEADASVADNKSQNPNRRPEANMTVCNPSSPKNLRVSDFDEATLEAICQVNWVSSDARVKDEQVMESIRLKFGVKYRTLATIRDAAIKKAEDEYAVELEKIDVEKSEILKAAGIQEVDRKKKEDRFDMFFDQLKVYRASKGLREPLRSDFGPSTARIVPTTPVKEMISTPRSSSKASSQPTTPLRQSQNSLSQVLKEPTSGFQSVELAPTAQLATPLRPTNLSPPSMKPFTLPSKVSASPKKKNSILLQSARPNLDNLSVEKRIEDTARYGGYTDAINMLHPEAVAEKSKLNPRAVTFNTFSMKSIAPRTQKTSTDPADDPFKERRAPRQSSGSPIAIRHLTSPMKASCVRPNCEKDRGLFLQTLLPESSSSEDSSGMKDATKEPLLLGSPLSKDSSHMKNPYKKSAPQFSSPRPNPESLRLESPSSKGLSYLNDSNKRKSITESHHDSTPEKRRQVSTNVFVPKGPRYDVNGKLNRP